MKFMKVPEQEKWKIPIVEELLEVQNDFLALNDFDRHDRNEMLRLLTTA